MCTALCAPGPAAEAFLVGAGLSLPRLPRASLRGAVRVTTTVERTCARLPAAKLLDLQAAAAGGGGGGGSELQMYMRPSRPLCALLGPTDRGWEQR